MLECKGWCLINQGVIILFFKELLIQHVILSSKQNNQKRGEDTGGQWREDD